MTQKSPTESMKKLRITYKGQNEKEGKQKVTLCFVVTILILFTACSNSYKTTSDSTLEEKADSIAFELQPSQLETTAKPEIPILEKLEGDMVYVENDTSSFYICKYEVTQKLWKTITGDNPSEMQGDDLPVEQVNWNDCQAFISKLNELTGKHYRLPTEAEWEYACKGGKYTKGYKYSGSNDIEEVAWYDGNSAGKSHPVGQKKPNELGLYDMSGNVWEWCQDMKEGTGMCHGGSWIHNARNCDPSLPNETPQSFYINCLGLRLAL